MSRLPMSRLQRRQFLQITGLAAATTYPPRPTMAGPFDGNDYLEVVPTDKRLAQAWLDSLVNRGEKQTYHDPAALRHIGMPIGGMFAGTVYLGGDGRLWLWDIFNRDQEGIAPRPFTHPLPNAGDDEPLVRNMTRGGHNYLDPVDPFSPFAQGFTLRVNGQPRPLNEDGFPEVTFDGRYPLGRVTYTDSNLPVDVRLEAFSPFIPLDTADSSLPVTVLRYTVTNRSDKPLHVELSGHLQNPVCGQASAGLPGQRHNRTLQNDRFAAVLCSAAAPTPTASDRRPDILVDDFERADHGPWTATGEAFGAGPAARRAIPDYQGNVGGEGDRVINSHSTAPGSNVTGKDSRQGTLTREPFTIARRFLQMYVGGGSHMAQTCVNLIVDGKVVRSATGADNNQMRKIAWDVSAWEGQPAVLQIVDQVTGAWGNIGVDHIVQTDHPQTTLPLVEQPDFGSMTLTLLGQATQLIAHADLTATTAQTATTTQTAPHAAPHQGDVQPGTAQGALGDTLIGHVGRATELAAGATTAFDFMLAWHFPNLTIRGMPGQRVGHEYAARFANALEVTKYVAENFQRLTDTTLRWVDTWYDSTLPYWLLDRTMANTTTLATTTCYRLRDGRFWAWEGIGCCPGTCTHVWHYAQALGRLFPDVERDQRERVDFGLALHSDGVIGHRSYFDQSAGPAVDGQCGRILAVYREHQMSADDAFLKRLWPRVRQAVQWLIRHDGDDDGLLQGAQHNTLDAAWYGKIAWLSSLYLATLRATAVMAREVGDTPFAERCARIADRGAQSILETYNGEYFIQIEDPAHQREIATGNGCHIDQVFGQTWAHWVGLETLFDRDKQLSALRALWKYNFVPDVGPFRARFKRGRWYAATGDAGLLMCTWPHADQKAESRDHWQFGYFNECMSGFEWQVAAHMIWESIDQPDLLEKGLAIARAIHDRYDARLRNPYNEIECSDHYARAMASYGVFQAVCGYQVHGPQHSMAFAPRLTPDNFQAAFVGPTGWGSYQQTLAENSFRVTLDVRHGHVELETLQVQLPQSDLRVLQIHFADEQRATHQQDGTQLRIVFPTRQTISAGNLLRVDVRFNS